MSISEEHVHPAVVSVVYRREGKTEAFTGRIEDASFNDFHFSSVTFEALLELIGAALRRSPGYRLLMRREEAPYPMTLPPNIEEMLRTDVQAAIKAFTVVPQRIEIGVPRKPRPELVGTLRYGHDTLADALGDEVYIKVRAGARSAQAEDPVTGRWVPLILRGMVPHCGTSLRLTGLHQGVTCWASARVEDILALSKSRYYLPRRWNPSGGWISHDALAEMYAFYQKEKADVSTI